MGADHRLDVLLIDDSMDYYVLVRGLLETRRPERWKVRWAGTVDQALEQMSSKAPDVILLDHLLGPHTRGLDLLPFVLEQAPEAVVLYVTALGREAGTQAMAGGAHEWVDKGQVTTGELESAIEQALARSDDSDGEGPDRLRAFLADLVDGLGNPLTLLVENLNELRNTASPTQLELLDDVQTQLDQLTGRVDAMGALVWPEQVSVSGLNAMELLAEAQDQAERRAGGHRVVIRGTARVQGHRAGLVFVLRELLLNAFEAAPGKSVQVQLTEAGGQVRIAIEYKGPGIPPLEHATARWSSDKDEQHAGLGLHHARTLVEAMGGSLAFEDGEVGTRVVVTLATAVDALPRLLVVDDEPLLLRTLRRTLEGSYVITTASNLGEGRAAREAGDFDLVLSDIVMPDGSGLDLYQWVTEERPALAKRFVFMTGHARDSRAANLFRRTALPVVSKPFRSVELRRVLAGLLEH